jgi:hypothetical protein
MQEPYQLLEFSPVRPILNLRNTDSKGKCILLKSLNCGNLLQQPQKNSQNASQKNKGKGLEAWLKW